MCIVSPAAVIMLMLIYMIGRKRVLTLRTSPYSTFRKCQPPVACKTINDGNISMSSTYHSLVRRVAVLQSLAFQKRKKWDSVAREPENETKCYRFISGVLNAGSGMIEVQL